MNNIAIAYTGQSDVIATLRDANAVFDEICRDFDEIASALTELKINNAASASDHINDLTVSLEGLHDEISRYLNQLA